MTADSIEAATILVGDCLESLQTLPDGCVHCCVTSPPYWGLRDYGTAEWEGGEKGCDHKPDAAPRSARPAGRLDGGKEYCDAQQPPFRAVCGKCGARRVDRQIGLEETPDKYVAKMVAVFREVRRVLRDDGTLWLNLGDSYANTGAADSSKVGGFTGDRIRNNRKGIMDSRPRGIPSGLKPKDLVGIPWRVAFALQQPYYSGSIKDERDRIWLAAMLDAEGCMFVHKRKAGQHNGQGYYRQNDNYGPGVEICNTSLAVVEKIMALVGKGSICTAEAGKHRRKQTLYRWNLRTTESREFVRELYPHLVAKRHQARLLYGCPSSGDDAERAHAGLIALHGGRPTDIDCAEPPTLFEKGYYLRQDVVWSKSNPMPESVTDRCTKAHEYLFLLSKSERYHFDHKAIAEPATTAADATCRSWDRESEKPPGQPGPPQKRLGRSGNTQRRPASDRGVPVDTGGRTNGAVAGSVPWQGDTRNRRSVWTVATQPYKDAHFATFPPKLIEPCILAGCPAGGTVLDPFLGSGTTAAVAIKHGRKAIGCELNPKYVKMAKRRIASEITVFHLA